MEVASWISYTDSSNTTVKDITDGRLSGLLLMSPLNPTQALVKLISHNQAMEGIMVSINLNCLIILLAYMVMYSFHAPSESLPHSLDIYITPFSGLLEKKGPKTGFLN